jgi:hypothetical protein
VSQTRCNASSRCCAEPGPRKPQPSLQHGPRLCSAPLRGAALRQGHETEFSGTPASTSSLRAQRSDPESHRGKTLDCFAALAMTAFLDSTVAPSARAFFVDTPSHPRGLFRPSFASSPCPLEKEGAGKTGRRLAPAVHCAKLQSENLHSGIQVKPKRPAFPAQRFYGLCRALPGERCTIAPVASWMTDARARSGRHITTRLDAQTPGVRTTRFCRTREPHRSCARRLRSRLPALRSRSRRCGPASAAVRPAFVTIAIRPSSLGRVAAIHAPFPNFGKVEYFQRRALTDRLGVLPDGQRKGL